MSEPTPKERTRSSAYARKVLSDYLDSKRPWANHASMYDAMEEIVDAAEFAFTGDRRPTRKEYSELEAFIHQITLTMATHPEGYEGPCSCEECREG